MDRRTYVEQVLANLRRVTPDERAAIREEIDGHIEDHICDLLELGYDEKLAEERTMAAMGDPEEVGRELDKQYPLFWLIISRAAMTLVILLGVISLLSLPGMRDVKRNILARVDPEQGSYRYIYQDGQYTYTTDMDIRAEVGNDVLFIYRVGVMPPEEDGRIRAVVWACNYDQRWLGISSNTLLKDLRFTTETLEQAEDQPKYLRYRDWLNIYVTREDRYIEACYDQNGYDVRVEIPLCWEEWEANETP